jgi:molecular chaperone DnaK
MSDLKNALKGTDAEEIKKKTQNLIQVSMKLGEAIYKDQQKGASEKSTQQNNTSKKEDKENVVDADFEDVKEDKKDKDKDKDKEKRA